MPALSPFLPAGFDPTRPVALIAGQGRYPALVVECARAAGVPVRLIALDEETSPELQAAFPENERVLIKVGQIGAMLKAIKRFDAGHAYMAGQVSPRKLFSGLHPDLKAIAMLASLKRRNAETIFGAIAAEIEKIGVTLLDARAFIDDHLASPGAMTRKKFPIEDDYLQHGLHIARECARLDIGQGCVVRKGTVLAVEAYEGTDEMIRRAGTLKTDQCLYVKTVKARQDYRFDVPCFGLKTLESLDAANIRAAALEAGRVILIDKPAVLARADQLGISLLGVA
ncbi:MAG: UDP-2,3-diacylglucosamine diphosphatase LpxI [Verrucomicrobiota bacterium]